MTQPEEIFLSGRIRTEVLNEVPYTLVFIPDPLALKLSFAGRDTTYIFTYPNEFLRIDSPVVDYNFELDTDEGTVEFHIGPVGNDMKIAFPGDWKVFPQKADFFTCLEAVREVKVALNTRHLIDYTLGNSPERTGNLVVYRIGMKYYFAMADIDEEFGLTEIDVADAREVSRILNDGFADLDYRTPTWQVRHVDRKELVKSGDFDLMLSGEVVARPNFRELRQMFESIVSDAQDRDLRTLEETYPDVHRLIEDIKGNFDLENYAWAFTVHVRPNPKPLLRYRGTLTDRQVLKLRLIAGVPDNVEATNNGEWTEYIRYENLKPAIIFSESFDPAETDWYYHEIEEPDEDQAELFVNGKFWTDQIVDGPKMVEGDLLVWVVVEDDFGSFDQLPTADVYRQSNIERNGPYRHPDFTGKTPYQISEDSYLRQVLRINKKNHANIMVVASCGHPNCHLHHVDSEESLWTQTGSPEAYQYSFQSPKLIGDNGTDMFAPWAPAVIGREIVSRVRWPSEVSVLEVDGEDKTGRTCRVTVTQGTKIKVVLQSSVD